jgi:predicted RNase H-like HicB family nuclease
MKKRKTPREKKALSYIKDRRNDYGENDKSSRKNIPLRKAKQNRAYRKKANDILAKVENKIDPEEIELVENEVKSVKKRYWKKCPDAPLGKVVERKLESREKKVGMGKTARKSTREIIKNLKIELSQKEDIWIAKAKELSGIEGKGETKKEAVENLNYIAKAAIENSLGFNVGILINGNYTEPIIKINQEK